MAKKKSNKNAMKKIDKQLDKLLKEKKEIEDIPIVNRKEIEKKKNNTNNKKDVVVTPNRKKKNSKKEAIVVKERNTTKKKNNKKKMLKRKIFLRSVQKNKKSLKLVNQQCVFKN